MSNLGTSAHILCILSRRNNSITIIDLYIRIYSALRIYRISFSLLDISNRLNNFRPISTSLYVVPVLRFYIKQLSVAQQTRYIKAMMDEC